MGGASEHVSPAQLKRLHQNRGGGGGRGCLTRHAKRDPGNQCSHIWQAVVKARAEPAMYEIPGMPQKSATLASNFNHFLSPYWHNAHHIVPNGSLQDSIAATGKAAGAAGLPNLIKQGLLKAEYNLNDKINMVILPIESKYAILLGLPRHLSQDEIGPGEKAEYFSHRAYNRETNKKLKPIMDAYKKIVADALDDVEGTHGKPEFTLSKKRIENLSERMFASIKAAATAKSRRGKALTQLTKQIFNR